MTPVIWTGRRPRWNGTPPTRSPPWRPDLQRRHYEFQTRRDIVQFDNSTAAGGTVDISSGNVFSQKTAVVQQRCLCTPTPLQVVTVSGGAYARFSRTAPGLVIMTASNSYTGGTAINGGTLQIGDGATTNGTIGNGQYNIAASGRLYLNYVTAVPAGTLTWSNDISGAGTLELNSAQPVNGTAYWGQGTLFSSGFTGTLQLDNGRIDASEAGLGGTSNIIINADGQLLATTGTYSQSITIAGNGWGESGYPGALRTAFNTAGDVGRSDHAFGERGNRVPIRCQFHTVRSHYWQLPGGVRVGRRRIYNQPRAQRN